MSSGTSNSPQVKLMLEWDQGFQKRDLALIAKSLHKDYRHSTYPRSIGRPEQTREEWLDHIASVLSLWTDHKVSEICYSNPPRHG